MTQTRRHLQQLWYFLLAAAVVAAVLVPYLLGYMGEGLLVVFVGILAWLVRRQIRVSGIPWFAPGEVDREPRDRER
jgi:hypothetical protein